MKNNTTQRRILVTGGAGFLGSHLCERLLQQQHEVLCVDNFYTGTKRNIAHLLGNPQFELMRHDITFPLYVEVDAIYNLACPASPIHYQTDPVQTTKVNVHGSINLLGLAKRVGARILQASTSEVYGDPSVHPQPESYCGSVTPTGPRACYDEGKRCAETLFFDYHRQHDVEIKVARIFNTYGPRMHENDGRVVSNFIVQALRNEPITLYGDGSQTRPHEVDGVARRVYRSGQHRQRRGIHRAGARAENHRPHRLALQAGVQTAADQRSKAAPARPYAGEGKAGLRTTRVLGRRAAQDHRVLRPGAPHRARGNRDRAANRARPSGCLIGRQA
jgi:nucleoside-diphosphate-sugar epimerase